MLDSAGVPLAVEVLIARGYMTFILFSAGRLGDLPPLKWSSLKYDFRMEDKLDGKEEAYG